MLCDASTKFSLTATMEDVLSSTTTAADCDAVQYRPGNGPLGGALKEITDWQAVPEPVVLLGVPREIKHLQEAMERMRAQNWKIKVATAQFVNHSDEPAHVWTETLYHAVRRPSLSKVVQHTCHGIREASIRLCRDGKKALLTSVKGRKSDGFMPVEKPFFIDVIEAHKQVTAHQVTQWDWNPGATSTNRIINNPFIQNSVTTNLDMPATTDRILHMQTKITKFRKMAEAPAGRFKVYSPVYSNP